MGGKAEMNSGDRVMTDLGPGTIKCKEALEGYLSNRYCVILDVVPPEFKNMHDEQGGLYMHKNRLEKIK